MEGKHATLALHLSQVGRKVKKQDLFKIVKQHGGVQFSQKVRPLSFLHPPLHMSCMLHRPPANPIAFLSLTASERAYADCF